MTEKLRLPTTPRERWRRLSLAEVCERFKMVKANKSRATLKKYNWIIGRLAGEFPKFNLPIGEIIKSDLTGYFASLKMMPRSHNEFTEVVSQIFEQAVDDGLIKGNPLEVRQARRVKGVSKEYRRKVVRDRRMIPTPKEVETIVRNIRAQKYADTSEASADFVMFYTPLRSW